MDLDIKIRNTAADARAEHEAHNRRVREKELAMRQAKAAQVQLQEMQDLLPNMRFQVRGCMSQLRM